MHEKVTWAIFTSRNWRKNKRRRTVDESILLFLLCLINEWMLSKTFFIGTSMIHCHTTDDASDRRRQSCAFSAQVKVSVRWDSTQVLLVAYRISRDETHCALEFPRLPIGCSPVVFTHSTHTHGATRSYLDDAPFKAFLTGTGVEQMTFWQERDMSKVWLVVLE